jgi:hypothetical protein
MGSSTSHNPTGPDNDVYQKNNLSRIPVVAHLGILFPSVISQMRIVTGNT